MRQLPVVQNGQLVGVLRRSDILRWLKPSPKCVASRYKCMEGEQSKCTS